MFLHKTPTDDKKSWICRAVSIRRYGSKAHWNQWNNTKPPVQAERRRLLKQAHWRQLEFWQKPTEAKTNVNGQCWARVKVTLLQAAARAGYLPLTVLVLQSFQKVILSGRKDTGHVLFFSTVLQKEFSPTMSHKGFEWSLRRDENENVS